MILINDKEFCLCKKSETIENKEYYIPSKNNNLYFVSLTDEKEYLLEGLVDLISEKKEIFVFFHNMDCYIVFNNSETKSIKYSLSKFSINDIIEKLKFFNIRESETKEIFVFLPEEMHHYKELFSNFKCTFMNKTFLKEFIDELPLTHKKEEFTKKSIIFTVLNLFIISISVFVFSYNLTPYLNNIHNEKQREIRDTNNQIENLKKLIEKERKSKQDEETKYRNIIFDNSELSELPSIDQNELLEIINQKQQIVIKYGKLLS